MKKDGKIMFLHFFENESEIKKNKKKTNLSTIYLTALHINIPHYNKII